VVKNEKGRSEGLFSAKFVVDLKVEEERSLTSRKSQAAVLQKKSRPRLLDKKTNLPGSVNQPSKGRRSKDKKTGSKASSSEEG